MTSSLMHHDKAASLQRTIHIARCARRQASHHAGSGRLTNTPSDTLAHWLNFYRNLLSILLQRFEVADEGMASS
jgi:hypothetical protein